ncbi:MAG: transglutaminase family protein [Cyanobacteria bacterium]|nr:transglutaminase family protein [Cyanobacteriota bacterium]
MPTTLSVPPMVQASSASDTPAWMGRVAGEVDRRLEAAGIRLTLGGEPTYVPLEPSGAEWSVAADGPTKLPMARAMARELQRTAWPGSTLLYCPGKRYEGEVNPRWALRLFTGLDGQPAVRWPAADGASPPGAALAPAAGPAWLARLAELLGVALEPLELRDPLDPGRRVWAVPLSAAEPDPDLPTAAIQWLPAAWPLDESLRQLSGAPGPAGLRLPLEHFPEGVPRQVLTLETDGEGWELFLPPLFRRPLTALLQAVADSLTGLAAPQLSGMLPVDWEGHWQMLGLTADPGVLEINLPICHGWADYDRWLRLLERAGERVGLRSWKQDLDGRQEGTGGGNHLLWGGPSLEEHPFFRRPGWLAGILRYWQHHPSLAYLFSGACVGPASQAPRPDEAAGDCFDLELAYRCLEQADDGGGPDQPGSDQRGVIGETLRHLHADRSGNNHRSEISFDKFWNPGAPAGCLGLVEFRALESMPSVQWSSAVALLWSALATHLLDRRHRPSTLRDWGCELHDRMLLPSALWSDLEAVAELEVRPALEPWPLICDFPREGGFTSRFVDGSLRRFEITANAAFRREWRLGLSGRPLSLPTDGSPLAVRYRLQRLYPCLHPVIAPHLPLVLSLHGMGEGRSFLLNPEGTALLAETEAAAEPQGQPWRGRRRSDDSTIDLRLG